MSRCRVEVSSRGRGRVEVRVATGFSLDDEVDMPAKEGSRRRKKNFYVDAAGFGLDDEVDMPASEVDRRVGLGRRRVVGVDTGRCRSRGVRPCRRRGAFWVFHTLIRFLYRCV